MACKAKSSSFLELPDYTKEKILNFLPIKEAERTSILSSKWRYTWSSIPELRLSEHALGNGYFSFVELVDIIFVLRNGPIRKFHLSSVGPYHEAYDRWILNLSRNGIRDISLELCPNYVMHSSFFSCDALNYVNLINSSLKLPQWFKGFKLLHTLALQNLDISDENLEKLVSSCLQLKKMMLYDLGKFIALKIHAPNLESLEIEGYFSYLQVCAPKLIYLYVDMLDLPDDMHKNNNFTRVLGNLPDLETLEVRGWFLEYLCVEPLKFPSAFTCLHDISLVVDFEDAKKNAFLLALFKRAPHLQSLDIEVNMTFEVMDSPSSTFWEMIDITEGLFKQLRRVKIGNLLILFVKFILGSTLVLNILTISEYSEHKGGNKLVLNQLTQFPRISPKAQIFFE